MSLWVRLLITVVLLIAAFYALSALIGAIVWVGFVALVIAGIVALIRGLGGEDKPRIPSRREEKRLDSAAERSLKDLEQRVRK